MSKSHRSQFPFTQAVLAEVTAFSDFGDLSGYSRKARRTAHRRLKHTCAELAKYLQTARTLRSRRWFAARLEANEAAVERLRLSLSHAEDAHADSH